MNEFKHNMLPYPSYFTETCRKTWLAACMWMFLKVSRTSLNCKSCFYFCCESMASLWFNTVKHKCFQRPKLTLAKRKKCKYRLSLTSSASWLVTSVIHEGLYESVIQTLIEIQEVQKVQVKKTSVMTWAAETSSRTHMLNQFRIKPQTCIMIWNMDLCVFVTGAI